LKILLVGSGRVVKGKGQQVREEKMSTEKAVEENTTLVQKVTEGGEYFAVAHIFASFNDTFVVSCFHLNCDVGLIFVSCFFFPPSLSIPNRFLLSMFALAYH
jgi:hypothetical protein